MLTFSKLSKTPFSFQRMTGVTVEQFEKIAVMIRPLWDEAERARLSRPDRQRAIGAGAKYHLPTLNDKLLVLFMYYRTYITMEFLGFLFDIHKSNISRVIEKLEKLMKKTATLLGDKPKRDRSQRKRINNLEDFMKKYPEMKGMIVDATEQETQRPQRGQKAYYSGKKKRHTMKNQIIINEKGEIIDTTDSHPGAKHDKKVFDESPFVKSLPNDIGIDSDSGYQGIKDDFPHARTPFKKKRGGPALNKIQKRFNHSLSRIRVLVENVIRRVKIFKILSYRYRGNRKKHGNIFKSISFITNMKFGFSG